MRLASPRARSQGEPGAESRPKSTRIHHSERTGFLREGALHAGSTTLQLIYEVAAITLSASGEGAACSARICQKNQARFQCEVARCFRLQVSGWNIHVCPTLTCGGILSQVTSLRTAAQACMMSCNICKRCDFIVCCQERLGSPAGISKRMRR